MGIPPTYGSSTAWSDRIARSAADVSQSLLGSSLETAEDLAALHHGSRKFPTLPIRTTNHEYAVRKAPKPLSGRHRAVSSSFRSSRNAVSKVNAEAELDAFLDQECNLDLKIQDSLPSMDGSAASPVRSKGKKRATVATVTEASYHYPERSVSHGGSVPSCLKSGHEGWVAESIDCFLQNRDMLSDETLDELLEASTMDISTATGTDSKQRDVNVQERKQMSQAAYRLELISDHMLRSAFKPAMTRTPAFECSYSRMRHADDMVFKEGFEVERRVPLNGSSSSAQQRESGKDEEDEAFVFHCPWVDCHKRLKQGMQHVLDSGHEGLLCVHADCHLGFMERHEWRDHILSAHHDILSAVQSGASPSDQKLVDGDSPERL